MRFISIHTLSLLAVTILISRHSHAQNLIPNPGFEQYVANPNVTGSGVNESIAWEKLDNTTDFFHRAYGSALHGIPLNFRGYQETASGSGYAGIRTYPALTGEFLVARLSAPLEKGQMYQAGFQANLSNLATYATDDIGMAFFYDIPEEQSVRDSIFHIKNPEGRFLTDTVDWTEVSGYYLARGGEQYALLGNFAAPRDVNVIVNVENNDMPWAYYYIDDVVVEPCDTQRIEQGTVLDTVICEGAPLVLSGMEGAGGHLWEGVGTMQEIMVEKAGNYVLYNYYDYCVAIRQEFSVKAGDCDCSITLPTLYSPSERLAVTASLNVQSYRLWIYDALGRLVLTTNGQQARNAELPSVSGAYFWKAELKCLNDNDIPIRRTLSGKMVVAR
ncbi:MAG: hypothetical protein H6573_15730 [Lewinellaceae bacterium]|nr:hypothetical protein [Lewinellaceae bacterium]